MLGYLVSAFAFIFLVIGITAVALPETNEALYLNKEYLVVAGDVCSGVGAYWFFAPILVPCVSWASFFMIAVSFLFFYFTWRFYCKEQELK